MEFRLLYQGELLPSGNSNRRATEKHAIRRSLHPQLRRLWQSHPALQELARRVGIERARQLNEPSYPRETDKQHHIDLGITAMGQNWQRAGYDFVPLVTSRHGIRCSLDILLLRPEDERFIFKQGDIDGQIKTLFDAFRLPASLSEVAGASPQQDETPFFVLLEDDKLISEVRVNSDQLLLLPANTVTKANDCFAVIHVKLNYKAWSKHPIVGWSRERAQKSKPRVSLVLLVELLSYKGSSYFCASLPVSSL